MVVRRSTGKIQVARALWYVGEGRVELRPTPINLAVPGALGLRMLFSGISRGTERLIFEGRVGKSEYERMRAPFQDGDFPFPVKYGYCATAVIENGPPEIVGRTVFCLHPHQDYFVVPSTAVSFLPEGLPPRRATLAANMETALNAMWDSGSTLGDNIVIVGAGIVGLLVAYLAARIPGTHVTVIDTNPARAHLVETLGATFRLPDSPPPDASFQGADVVFHTSATSAGLNTAIAAAGPEAPIVEMSWYGDQAVEANLGGAFHSGRLRLIASQVGQIPPHRQKRWSHARRLAKALDLLQDPILDALVADEISFDDTPKRLPELFSHDAKDLAPVIRYPQPNS